MHSTPPLHASRHNSTRFDCEAHTGRVGSWSPRSISQHRRRTAIEPLRVPVTFKTLHQPTQAISPQPQGDPRHEGRRFPNPRKLPLKHLSMILYCWDRMLRPWLGLEDATPCALQGSRCLARLHWDSSVLQRLQTSPDSSCGARARWDACGLWIGT